ncbi:unnamed protein product [Pieris macdunnoughi]|uniref:Peptidoglycan recognition protein n=1 Tax=Pieris macdunnoughi TaxID=345717 RepID=A0A821VZ93_9NEOP|nr:unnamed protein product [Pieris macdunnoughi]
MLCIFYLELLMCTITFAKSVPADFKEEPLENEVITYDFPLVRRGKWNARKPTHTLPLNVPVPYVVIHHSYSPSACEDSNSCAQAMRSMQNYHMDEHGWWDIGYNFGIGGDGAAYEGRGWTVLGAHSLRFNNYSLGICLIGDWRYKVPPALQIKTAKELISAGVDLGFIKADYKLIGHRQVRDTECPGDALYEEIKQWKNYSPFPATVTDLVDVVEIPESIRGQWKENGTLKS